MSKSRVAKKQIKLKFSKILTKLLVLSVVFLSYAGQDFSYYFQANILLDIQHKPFDGTVMPVQIAPKWSDLTNLEYEDIKSGILNYDNFPKNKIENIVKYDPTILAQKRTPENTDTALTYITAYLGQYTGGAGEAHENDGSHAGVDIKGLIGTPIYAIANGVVEKAKTTTENGNYVVIRHSGIKDNNGTEKTYYSSYLHLDKFLVTPGEVVDKNMVIGYMGTTGLSTTPHLHFQIDNEDAPFHPYWPFTWDDVKQKNTTFFNAVNEGLGKDNATKYTINPMTFVYQYTNVNNSTPVVIKEDSDAKVASTDNIIVATQSIKNDTKITTVTPTIPTTTPTKNETTTTTPVVTQVATTTQLPVASIKIELPTKKFTPGKPFTINLSTVDNQGNTTSAYLFGDIIISDLDKKPITQAKLTGESFKDGKLSTQITILQGLPYNINAGSGIIRGTAQVFPNTDQIFTDVPVTNLAYKAIQEFTLRGYIKGYANGLFSPDQSMTRAEYLKVMFGSFNIQTKSINLADLSDEFQSTDWTYPYLMTAQSLGIIKGYDDGTLRPNEQVTQSQAIKMALVAKKKIDSSQETEVWYKIYEDKLNELGIKPFTKGFSPDKVITRAEATQLMYELSK